VRKIEEANQIVLKTLEIIDYLQPKFYFIENPQTGLLKNQYMMQDLPFKDIDYCKYGMSYRKRTRIWSNVTCWKPRPLCQWDCGSIVDGKHKATAQRGPSRGNRANRQKQTDLYRIPDELIH